MLYFVMGVVRQRIRAVKKVQARAPQIWRPHATEQLCQTVGHYLEVLEAEWQR